MAPTALSQRLACIAQEGESSDASFVVSELVKATMSPPSLPPPSPYPLSTNSHISPPSSTKRGLVANDEVFSLMRLDLKRVDDVD